MHFWHLFLALASGSALGAFYFGALWMTVRRLPDARRPWLLSLGSFWIRLVVTLGGFYLTTQGRWENLAACLAGFFLARWVFIRRYQPKQAGLPTR